MENAVTALVESSASSFDIGGMVGGMATEMLTGITATITSLTPVITTVILVAFAVRAFKKYVK